MFLIYIGIRAELVCLPGTGLQDWIICHMIEVNEGNFEVSE